MESFGIVWGSIPTLCILPLWNKKDRIDLSWKVRDEESMKAGNNIFCPVVPNLICKSPGCTMLFFTLERPMRLSSGHPCVENSTPLCWGRASTSPNPSVSECDEAGIFFLDSMYLATEIVLEKTGGPTTVSQPHFLPQGLAGVAVQSKPNQSHSLGFFQLRTQRIRPFSLSGQNRKMWARSYWWPWFLPPEQARLKEQSQQAETSRKLKLRKSWQLEA